MLGYDITKRYQIVATVIMTGRTTLLRGLRGIYTRIVAYVMNMTVTRKVVSGMALAAIASCG
jgi:hypothetical protein